MSRSLSVVSVASRKLQLNWGLLSAVMLFGAATALLSGCGMGKLDTTSSPIAATATAIQGHVHGGQQPVTGATIQLYEVQSTAGESGYPGDPGFTSAKPLLSGITTDSSGNFNITGDWGPCHDGADQMYITGSGGNPGLPAGTVNNALFLMAALGPCSGLTSSTSININEVTTVASAYAIAQFAAPNASGKGIVLGTSLANTSGIANAFSTVNNLVNISTGTALSITPAYVANPVQYFNTSTVPQARINTLANILATCVNSNGSGCSTLFANATPPGGTAPIDTLQAILDIAHNPGNNVATLAGLSSPTAPFQPSLSTTPTDFMLALTFTGAGLGLSPADAQGAGGELTYTGLAIDANSKIWVSAYNIESSNLTNGGAMLAEFNNVGAPITPASVQTTPTIVQFGGYPTASYNTTTNQFTGAGIKEPVGIAFDESGLLWVLDQSVAQFNAFNSTGVSQFGTPGSSIKMPGGGDSPESLAVDGVGTLWISASKGAIFTYSSSTGTVTSPAGGYTGGGSYGSLYYALPISLTFDSSANGYLWASDYQFGDLYLINAQTGQLMTDYFPSNGTPTKIVAGAAGNIYACPASRSSIQIYNSSNTSGAVTTFPSATDGGCSGPMVVDGLGDLWSFGSTGLLNQYTSTGTALSPSGGYSASSFGEPGTIAYYPAATGSPELGDAANMAIDGSGNIWITSGIGTSRSAVPFNALIELVGAAGPVVTPVSAALAGNQIATRP